MHEVDYCNGNAEMPLMLKDRAPASSTDSNRQIELPVRTVRAEHCRLLNVKLSTSFEGSAIIPLATSMLIYFPISYLRLCHVHDSWAISQTVETTEQEPTYSTCSSSKILSMISGAGAARPTSIEEHIISIIVDKAIRC
jgi:hypothetical protein